MQREETEKMFPKGSRVKLNIGGPEMVVKGYVSHTGCVSCQWFVGKKLEEGQFAPESLLIVVDGTDSQPGRSIDPKG